MSTAIAEPARPAHHAVAHSTPFTGTIGLLRLYLRRDRVVLPLWVLLLSIPLGTVYVGSVDAVYPTQQARAGFAAAIMASPAQRALYGNIYGDSLGAAGIWKAGMFHVLIALAVILTVIRHTRADEETGRAELLDSTAVGRYAGLTAALLLAAGAAVCTGVIAFAGLLTVDVPATGSLAFAMALTATGLVFTAVAGVTAQLSPSSRVARGTAFSVLAATFTLRAVGDVTSSTGDSVFTWLSPLGWSLQVRPYAGDRFWILLLHIIFATALSITAYLLLARRDVGSGLLAERRGPATAAARLRGALSLALRLDRGAVALWTVGLVLYGLIIGSVVNGIGEEIGNSPASREIVERLGGTAEMEHAFIAVAFSMLAMIASAFAISLVLRLHAEESGQRAETVLAGSVSRFRWLTGHLGIALVAPAIALLLAGAVAGLTYGAAAGDISAHLAVGIGTAAVQLPAVWLMAALTLLLFGVLPRFAPAAWGVLVAFVALYLLGSLAGWPQWVSDLQPFAHTPRVGDGHFTAVPLLWITLIDVVLISLGALAFRRRDLR